ncbi:MAG TPA: hypothetical protein VGS41_02325 [Chthonomonadales bacterium]|nr:hypothetical protein [Chthonomonadales bacterium]
MVSGAIGNWSPLGWALMGFPLQGPDEETVLLDDAIELLHRHLDCAKPGDSIAVGQALHVAHLLQVRQEKDGAWPAGYNVRTGEPVGTGRSLAPTSLMTRLDEMTGLDGFAEPLKRAKEGLNGPCGELAASGLATRAT